MASEPGLDGAWAAMCLEGRAGLSPGAVGAEAPLRVSAAALLRAGLCCFATQSMAAQRRCWGGTCEVRLTFYFSQIPASRLRFAQNLLTPPRAAGVRSDDRAEGSQSQRHMPGRPSPILG